MQRVAELGALLGRLLRIKRCIPRRHERLLLRTLHTQRLLRHDNPNLGRLLGYANTDLGNGRDGLEIHTLSSRAQCASLPLELVCVLCCVLLELRSLGVLACGRSNSVRLRNGLTCLCCRLLLELLSLRSRLLLELWVRACRTPTSESSQKARSPRQSALALMSVTRRRPYPLQYLPIHPVGTTLTRQD